MSKENMQTLIRRVIFLLLMLILSNGKIVGQVNLVPNPSFEVYDTCPSRIPLRDCITMAVPWFQPNLAGCSTDYFNVCNTDVNFASVPSNYEGYQQALTGVGYAGFVNSYFMNYQEYLEIKLTDSFLTGKKYSVSFYVSFANISKKSCDGFGVYFSVDSVTYYDPFYGFLPLQPQVQNPSGNIINDTANWILISDTIVAQGGEKFMTIGNFKDDANTLNVTNNYDIHNYSYYYIDDVSVVLCDSVTGSPELFSNNLINLYPNPSTDVITISSTDKLTSIVIYNMVGAVVIQDFSNQTKTTLGIAALPKGVYFAYLTTTKGTVVKKFVKM